MNNTQIKLTLKPEASSGTISEIIISNFVRACEQLDASLFEPFIDDDQYFQDLDKYRFLQAMKDEFEIAKNRGAAKMKLKMGTCMGCTSGHPTHEFWDQEGKFMFAYIVEREGEIVKDIFVCNMSKGLTGR